MSNCAEGEGQTQGTPTRFVTEKVAEKSGTPKSGGSPASRHSVHSSEGGAPATSPGPQSPSGKTSVPDGDCTQPAKGKTVA